MAEESLASARRELEAGELRFAVNRLYYTLFYAVSAALLDRHRSFKRHAGVRTAFHETFMKTRLLPPESGELYDQLFEERLKGDYVAMTTFERGHVEQKLEQCAEFLVRLRPLISIFGPGP